MLDTNPDAPAPRRAVTSPNGTTERALNTFVDGGLFQLTNDAMRACTTRSAEKVSCTPLTRTKQRGLTSGD